MADLATLGVSGWSVTNPLENLSVPTAWQYAAATGLYTTATRIATLGNNPNIDTATQPEDVWAGAQLGVLNSVDHRFIPKPTSAVAMEVVSDSANDTAAGTGARTVVIGYLDSTYTAKTATITLNGTTAVAMPENVLRVNSVIVATVGTVGGNNIGNVSVRAAGGLGATYGYMAAAIGIARNSLYTVPAGFVFDILSAVLSINRTDTQNRWATYTLCIQNSAGRLLKGLELSNGSDSPYRHEANGIPINTIAAQNDVWVRCEAVSQNGTNTTAGLFGIQRQHSAVGP
jgi:hypothetical protein